MDRIIVKCDASLTKGSLAEKDEKPVLEDALQYVI